MNNHPQHNFPDHCSYDSANKLATRLRNYWSLKGHTIETTIGETVSSKADGGRGVIYTVRSNLVRGLPPL